MPRHLALVLVLLTLPSAASRAAPPCFESDVDRELAGQYVARVTTGWSRLEVRGTALLMCPGDRCWTLDLTTGALATSDEPAHVAPLGHLCAAGQALAWCTDEVSRPPTSDELASVPPGEYALELGLAYDDPDRSRFGLAEVFDLPSGRHLRTIRLATPDALAARLQRDCRGAETTPVPSAWDMQTAAPGLVLAAHTAGLSDCRQGSEAAWHALIGLHSTTTGALLATIGPDDGNAFEGLPEAVVRADGGIALVTYEGMLWGYDPHGRRVSALRVMPAKAPRAPLYPALLPGPDGTLVIVPELNPSRVLVVAADGKKVLHRWPLARCRP